MSVKDRIREVRNYIGLSQEALASSTGSKRTTIAGYENGISLPHAEFLTELSVKYRINPNWVLTGQGNMFNEVSGPPKSRLEQEFEEVIDSRTNPKFASIEERLARLEASIDDSRAPAAGGIAGNPAGETVPGYGAEGGDGGAFTGEGEPEYGAEERVSIPYVENIAAGPPIAQSEDQSGSVSVPARLIRKGRYYAASIRGASMAEAGIRDGDLVLIRHAGAPVSGAVQVVRYQGRSTLKRLREVEGGGWELHYEDGTGRVIPVDSGDYEVQGEFVAILPQKGGEGGPPEGRRTREKPFENR
jgi:SOS-response transcriptional repressor LexA